MMDLVVAFSNAVVARRRLPAGPLEVADSNRSRAVEYEGRGCRDIEKIGWVNRPGQTSTRSGNALKYFVLFGKMIRVAENGVKR